MPALPIITTVESPFERWEGIRPEVIARSAWGADESLRLGPEGKELSPPRFWSAQKLIVHHTAGKATPEPASILRAIQRFHALERQFGDIGYNLLIDREGKVYEGRFSSFAASGEAPPGHDPDGRAVAATHVLGYNAGTLSVALLGNFVENEPAPAAIESLTRTLAWLAGVHGLDPLRSGPYVNPVSDWEQTCPNVCGHGDLMATLCPGAHLAARLPEIRKRAAALIDSQAEAAGA